MVVVVVVCGGTVVVVVVCGGAVVVVVEVVGAGACVVVVVTVGAGAVDVSGAVVAVVDTCDDPEVPSGGTVVVGPGSPSMRDGSTRMTVGGVDVVLASVVAVAAAGISIDGWITRLRTWATAPQEKARAVRTARVQPPASFIQSGMTQLSQDLRLCVSLRRVRCLQSDSIRARRSRMQG